MKTYRILKNSETKLVARGRVLADGTLRMTDRETPIVLSEECAKRGLDPKKVQAAAAPIECLARLGMNPGGVEIVDEEEYTAAKVAAARAARTPAEISYDEIVRPEIIACDRAYDRRDHNYQGYLSARAAMERAKAEWAAKHPAAAEARSAKARAEREAHEAEIRSRPGYIAALEGRD